MRNLVQTVDRLSLTAPYAVASGAGALVGSLFVIAAGAAGNGAAFEGVTTGVFDITKTPAQTFAQGAKVYWDNSAKSVTGVSSGNTLIGVATRAAAGGDATARVRLGIVA